MVRTAAKRHVNLVGSAGGRHEPDFSSFDLSAARELYVYSPQETETWFSQDYDERWRLTVKLGSSGIDELDPELLDQLKAGGLSLEGAMMISVIAPALMALWFRGPMTWEFLKERYDIDRPRWLDFQPFRQDHADMTFRIKQIVERDYECVKRDPFFFVDTDEADD